MTYKDPIYEELLKYRQSKGSSISIEDQQTLAYEIVVDAVIRQYYQEAVKLFHGDLDAMGRGVYLYWDEQGDILDIATVPVDEFGDPPAGSAPVAHLLEECAIPHAVAPYRYGGTDWMDEAQAQILIQEVPAAARRWVKEMIPRAEADKIMLSDIVPEKASPAPETGGKTKTGSPKPKMSREERIIQNLKAGYAYILNSTTTGVSHHTVFFDEETEHYYVSTTYERYNPADTGSSLMDEEEAVALIISRGYHLRR